MLADAYQHNADVDPVAIVRDFVHGATSQPAVAARIAELDARFRDKRMELTVECNGYSIEERA